MATPPTRPLMVVALLLLMIPTAASWADDHNTADAAERRINDCGVNGLYLLLRRCGQEHDLATVRAALPAPGDKGLSMAQIAQASARLGQPLRGVRLRRSDLPLDRPFIALTRHGESGHFLLVEPAGRTGTMLAVLDFPRPPRLIDASTLLDSPEWTGLALLPQQPHERLAPYLAGTGAAGLLLLGIARLIRRRPGRHLVDTPNPALTQ